MGTGTIAHAFTEVLRHVRDAELVAVGSRTSEHAEQFATAHGIARAHSTYDALVDDDGVDVVYVATPHARHAADMTLCLEAGKHVLCEKPVTLNADEATRIARLAG